MAVFSSRSDEDFTEIGTQNFGSNEVPEPDTHDEAAASVAENLAAAQGDVPEVHNMETQISRAEHIAITGGEAYKDLYGKLIVFAKEGDTDNSQEREELIARRRKYKELEDGIRGMVSNGFIPGVVLLRYSGKTFTWHGYKILNEEVFKGYLKTRTDGETASLALNIFKGRENKCFTYTGSKESGITAMFKAKYNERNANNQGMTQSDALNKLGFLEDFKQIRGLPEEKKFLGTIDFSAPMMKVGAETLRLGNESEIAGYGEFLTNCGLSKDEVFSLATKVTVRPMYKPGEVPESTLFSGEETLESLANKHEVTVDEYIRDSLIQGFLPGIRLIKYDFNFMSYYGYIVYNSTLANSYLKYRGISEEARNKILGGQNQWLYWGAQGLPSDKRFENLFNEEIRKDMGIIFKNGGVEDFTRSSSLENVEIGERIFKLKHSSVKN